MYFSHFSYHMSRVLKSSFASAPWTLKSKLLNSWIWVKKSWEFRPQSFSSTKTLLHPVSFPPNNGAFWLRESLLVTTNYCSHFKAFCTLTNQPLCVEQLFDTVFKLHNVYNIVVHLLTRAPYAPVQCCIFHKIYYFISREHTTESVQSGGAGVHLHHGRRLCCLCGILCGRGRER